MKRVVFRLITFQLVIRPTDLVARILDLGLVLVDLREKFRNLERRHHLALLYMASVVHVQLLHIPGFLRVDIDLLKRNKFRGQSYLPGESLLRHLRDTYGQISARVGFYRRTVST